MPGFNQTGPMGRGPMTGRGRGLCASQGASFGPVSGCGLGYRRGRGRAFQGDPGSGYFVADPPYQGNYEAGDYQNRTDGMRIEIEKLQAQAESMQRSLIAINERIAKMGKSE